MVPSEKSAASKTINVAEYPAEAIPDLIGSDKYIATLKLKSNKGVFIHDQTLSCEGDEEEKI